MKWSAALDSFSFWQQAALCMSFHWSQVYNKKGTLPQETQKKETSLIKMLRVCDSWVSWIMPLPCSVKLVPSVPELDPLKCEGPDIAAAEPATCSMLNWRGERHTKALKSIIHKALQVWVRFVNKMILLQGCESVPLNGRFKHLSLLSSRFYENLPSFPDQTHLLPVS